MMLTVLSQCGVQNTHDKWLMHAEQGVFFSCDHKYMPTFLWFESQPLLMVHMFSVLTVGSPDLTIIIL